MKQHLSENGFVIVENVLTNIEIALLISIIEKIDTSNSTFRKSKELFAIRQFFKEIPQALEILLKSKLWSIIEQNFGREYFIVKSIYFDKPATSNWFVSYHQDLTISVDKKLDIEEFNLWTVKQGQFAVQPPLRILQDNFTIRIHLDVTTSKNGALKVIPGSHMKGIYRPENIDWTKESEIDCEVSKGGVMFMKPLLLHSSGRTVNNNRRRVIHVEFSRTQLPFNLCWSEYVSTKFPVSRAET